MLFNYYKMSISSTEEQDLLCSSVNVDPALLSFRLKLHVKISKTK